MTPSRMPRANPEKLELALGDKAIHGLPFVQHTLGFALGILDGVIDANIFQIPYYLRHAVKVRYSQYTAEWRVEGKTATGRSDIISSETYGTSRANAYKILEGLGHKLLDNTGVEPRCTQAHINFRGFQFSGLCLGQRLHIDGKLRVGFCRKLRHPQLCPDIAGQIFVCHLPARFRVGGVGGRVFEDHTGKSGRARAA